MEQKKSSIIPIAIVGGIMVVAILVFGTIWMGRSASKDAEDAARSVSLLYLDELAGRREQVVASNLSESIENMRVAIGLMTDEDLSDVEHLQAFQDRMKQLYDLEKFAFVDSDGLIYTSLGSQGDIDQYDFDYRTISEPEISVKNLDGDDKKVIIAIPVNDIPFEGKTLVACFMEIDMGRMLEGVSMTSDAEHDATFCNIYTNEGIALTNIILGNQASEGNLFDALAHAEFDEGYSYDEFVRSFSACERGVVSFTYNGAPSTLSYVPVEGTNWLLTYLISEDVISDQISSISDGIIARSVAQSVLTALVLLVMFLIMIWQVRKSARLALEKETSEAESRVKQQELEQRLLLQERLLEEERQRAQQARHLAVGPQHHVLHRRAVDDHAEVLGEIGPGREVGGPLEVLLRQRGRQHAV